MDWLTEYINLCERKDGVVHILKQSVIWSVNVKIIWKVGGTYCCKAANSNAKFNQYQENNLNIVLQKWLSNLKIDVT